MNVEIETLFAIRDAKGLNAKEKAFLFVVATRGECFTKWDRNAEDMGLSKRGYYDSRNSLLEKGLIRAERRMDDSTVYVVVPDALSRMGNEDSRMGNEDSRMGNGYSRSDEPKETSKVTKKETLKETFTTSPDGPVVPEDESSLKNEVVIPFPKKASDSSNDVGEQSQHSRMGNSVWDKPRKQYDVSNPLEVNGVVYATRQEAAAARLEVEW